MPIRTIAEVARAVSLFFGGLFAGFLTTVLVLELTLRSVEGQTYTLVRQVELVRLDDLATATLIPALIATALVVVLTAKVRGHALRLTVTALALLVIVLVTSLLFNVPINGDQLAWDVQAPPVDWVSVRDRWQIAHAVRTGAAMLAFGCLSIAAFLTRSTTRPATSSQGAVPDGLARRTPGAVG